MLSFIAWSFAAAGAVCALGPLIIHLLNRRRYRVVRWAAMDFLRQALKQHRRVLNIRDLILLVLRTAAVLLFGLALARPYFSRGEAATGAVQPVHAIVVIDNSLSMAYESLDGSLLDRAKDTARDFLEQLPAGSRCSIIAGCGSREALSRDPYDTKEAASEAVQRITVVDRPFSLPAVIAEIESAASAAPELTKQVVLISDHQELNWRGVEPAELAGLPPIQIVNLAPREWENTWIADLRLQDGLADVETPATVLVQLAHQGPTPRRDLQVTLSLGDVILAQKTVTVESGSTARAVEFECHFSGLTELPESGRPVFAPLRASITPDRLPLDDERFLIVPIVASLPVVFIDQLGAAGEDAAVGRLGETRHLRRLLAPRTSRAEAPRQLVSVRHLAPHEVTQQQLADARLVVVAGLHDPDELTPLLYQYVEQGGQLMLAAGGQFDPALWNEAAWNQTHRLLPLPLNERPLGQTPDEAADELKPFYLSFDSLAGEPYFQLAGVARAELEALYGEPLFFKAVQAMESSNAATGSDAARVLARYDVPERPPFLVARKIGTGQVILCTTGLLSPWNTLPKTNAFLLFDRVLRGMIEQTLPTRNFSPRDELTLPLPEGEQNVRILLERPGRPQSEPLDVSFIGAEQRGVTLTGALERGVYRLRGLRPLTMDASREPPLWELPLALNGAAEESNLIPTGSEVLDRLAAATNVRVVPAGARVELAGGRGAGRHTWWWLAIAVLVLLVAEMVVLLMPMAAFSIAPRSASGSRPVLLPQTQSA